MVSVPEQAERQLLDSVVAVTGAKAGIGETTARLLAKAGARVVVGARRQDRLDALVGEIGEARAVAECIDVRRPDDNERLVSSAIEHFGRLDAVVLNAGVGKYGGILDYDDAYANMIGVNVAGTVRGLRAAVPAVAPR